MELVESIFVHLLAAAYAYILSICALRLMGRTSLSAKFSLFHMLHLLLLSISMMRTCWLILLAWGVMENGPGSTVEFIVSSLPGFQFFTLWSLLACFWAELYQNYKEYGAYVPLPTIWRTAYILNGVMYTVALVVYFLRIFDVVDDELLTVTFYSFGSFVCFVCLIPYAVYGRRVWRSLLKTQGEQSATNLRRQKRLKSVTYVLGIGFVGLLVRSVFLLIIVHVEHLYENDWAQLAFYLFTDYVPIFMFVRILRKRPALETTPLLQDPVSTPTLVRNSSRLRL
eukprot:TRINITY_DN3790_c0_g1_i30.p1 TRINITY_DN3790_c0_g1~~TRINITY_DN3790_c0_g1_i30.p1  ORF type:complete len:323 (+),score=47.56 TRINITY_DN3790_c0_g1_i30:122-970(+)